MSLSAIYFRKALSADSLTLHVAGLQDLLHECMEGLQRCKRFLSVYIFMLCLDRPVFGSDSYFNISILLILLIAGAFSGDRSADTDYLIANYTGLYRFFIITIDQIQQFDKIITVRQNRRISILMKYIPLQNQHGRFCFIRIFRDVTS